MTSLPRKYCSGHRKVSKEESDPGIPGERNVQSGFQVQPEEDGGGSTSRNWTVTSGLWTASPAAKAKSRITQLLSITPTQLYSVQCYRQTAFSVTIEHRKN